eukprot:1515804-Rhodomonas_salina.1
MKGWQWQQMNGEEGGVQLLHGDKRQLTAVCTASMGRLESGQEVHVLPVQIVLLKEASLPKLEGVEYEQHSWGYGCTAAKKLKADTEHLQAHSSVPLPKKKVAKCFRIKTEDAEFARCVCTMALTHNHWSYATTSISYVELILVPYFLAQKAALGLPANAICIFIMDVWWGWLDKGFCNFVKQNYPWIRMVYVLAACTPHGQPCN